MCVSSDFRVTITCYVSQYSFDSAQDLCVYVCFDSNSKYVYKLFAVVYVYSYRRR